MKAVAVILTSVLGLLTAGAVSRSYFVEERLGAGVAPVPVESVDATVLEEVSSIAPSDDDLWEFIELPEWGSFSDMHDFYVESFVKSEGFGFRRMLSADDLKRSWTIALAGVPLRVDGLQLISLLEHDDPVAYVTEGITNKKLIQTANTRPLSEFEKSSLERLQAGEEMAFDAHASQPVVVGAVRARKQCLSCHDAKVGDLLGAFSYRLSKIEMEHPSGAATMTR